MLFHSLTFLGFFVAVLGLYWFLLRKHIRAQNVLLLIASYLFYGWWDWRFLGLIVVSSAIDFGVGIALDGAKGKARKGWLWLSISSNLGLLGFFKYYNFFLDSWVEALSWLGMEANLSTLALILPVGISFYTFQTLTYTIDRYRNQVEAVRDPIAFFAFVAFFPQLVAGPIERAKHLLPQFFKDRSLTVEQAHEGLRWILWGLFTKIVVADSLAPYVNAAYDNPTGYGGLTYMWATILFAFQIYGDFAGYSLMARGLARLLGFELMQNFNFPYSATTLQDFWRRWHVSLSTWFRDYVYIPLGGSRGPSWQIQRNLMLTFLLSGLWHGANWTFVIWGGLHGLALILERQIRPRLSLPNWLGWMVTFGWVCVAWAFFRSNGLSDVGNMGLQLWHEPFSFQPLLRPYKFLQMLVVLSVFLLGEWGMQQPIWQARFQAHRSLRWMGYLTICFLIMLFGWFGGETFIYFQF